MQGHLIGISRPFTNSGIIDLQSNPVAGDVLVITGGRQAGLAPTQPIAGVGGPGDFHLQWRHAQARHGPQRGGCRNALRYVGRRRHVGWPGRRNKHGNPQCRGRGVALTVGDGILVTEVLNPARSAAGAFSLERRPYHRWRV